nr:unnamed protein product [Callosobruchus analis]
MVHFSKLPFSQKIQAHCHVFNVFLSKSYAPKEWFQNSLLRPLVCQLKLLSNESVTQKTLYVKLLFLEDICPELNAEVGNICFNKVDIYTKKKNLTTVVEKFKEYLANHSDNIILINKDVPFEIEKDIIISLKFDPPDSAFCLVDNNFVRQCKYKASEDFIQIEPEKDDASYVIENVGNTGSVLQSALDIFSGKDTFGNVLLIGQQGTGKSSLLRAIMHKVQLHPKYMHINLIKCKTIKGKTMDSLEKLFCNTFYDLILHQPSLLLIDDLHIMCENIKDDESAPNAIYFNRISEMLHNFLKPYIAKHAIGICATSESLDKINKNIYSSRGSHIFKNVFTISELNKEDRKSIIKHLFQNYKLGDVDVDELSLKTDGFVFQDMVNFCEKAIYESLKQTEYDENLEITMQDCEKALKNTCILSLENVNIHSPGDKDFSRIGGLHNVKQILIETLLWPVKVSSS